MNVIIKVTAICITLLLISNNNLIFAGRSDVGTSGAVFLKLNSGSRPSAMGEAFVGIADDINAIFFNPAGSSNIEKVEFGAQYGVWFQGIAYNTLGFVYPVKKVGTFGLGIVNLSVNDIEKRAGDTIEYDSKFEANDYAYILHYSRNVLSNLSAGLNLKIISQKLDDKTAGAYAGDVGLLWRSPLRGVSVGFCAQNFGNEIKFIDESDPLPFNMKAGLGYNREITNKSNFTAGIDVNMPRDNDMMFSGGSEYKYKILKEFSAAIRAGYKTVSNEKLEGLSGLTSGAGIQWRQFSFDFAWVPYGILGDTFRYSMIVRF